MKIIINTLSKYTFDLEKQQTDTITLIQKLVSKIKYGITQQKILRKGILLLENQIISELEFQEKDLILAIKCLIIDKIDTSISTANLSLATQQFFNNSDWFKMLQSEYRFKQDLQNLMWSNYKSRIQQLKQTYRILLKE